MSKHKLTEPEYLILRVLVETEETLSFGGDAVTTLRNRGYVEFAGDGWRVTDAGRERAALPWSTPDLC